MSWLEARIVGVSVWGPGLPGWTASRGILAGADDYVAAMVPLPPPPILSATERRRTGPVARLALIVASEAAAMSGLPPGGLRSVFASAGGDGLIVGSILEDLARSAPDAARLVSPTQFHNSVHNAAAGYWSIATASERPTTCIACHDFTWAAGLLTAMAELATQGEPVLLCAYDHPMPPPLDAKRPTVAPFGVALVLSPRGAPGGMAGLSVRFAAEPPPCDGGAVCQPGLRPLAAGNAAARSLPLLEMLARGAAGSHALAYLDGRLDVAVTP